MWPHFSKKNNNYFGEKMVTFALLRWGGRSLKNLMEKGLVFQVYFEGDLTGQIFAVWVIVFFERCVLNLISEMFICYI
jgi:hypothetical protein